jgi:ATP-dependent RNA helicase DDX24/MAK5
VVDEADRIVEDGHFAEVHRIFSRIGDHENLAVEGKSPGQQKAAQAHNGGAKAKMDYGMDVDEELIGSEVDLDAMAAEVERNQVLKLDFEVPQELIPEMPTEEEIEQARKEQADTPYDDDNNDDDDDDDDEDDDEEDGDGDGDDTNVKKKSAFKKYKNKRQTLLFSATALRIKGLSEVHDAGRKGGKKKKKKLGPLPGLTAELSEQLPDHVHQLMRLVGKRPKVDIVDVTSKGALSTVKVSAAEKKEKKKKSGAEGEEEEDGGEEEEEDEEVTNSLARNLPKQLVHKQMNSPAEEKDVFAYAYLHVHPSERVLIFVNSIKTARRLDGLLRALNLNCRVIHAQLQQKQRLKALESFQASTSGILVATDVAARGLDIPNVDVVLHYDVARSSQVYIHRSGRTARANRAGSSISLVSPEDHMHHSAIVNVIGKAKLKGSGEEGKMTKTDKIKARLGGLLEHTVDTASLPVLRQRCALAKKIFLQSFLQGQQQKDSAWLQQTSKEAGIDVDADLAEELGGGSNATDSNSNLKGGGKGKQQQQQTKGGGKLTKKELDRLRWELRQMLAQPVGSATSGAGSRRKGFFVVNGGMQ